MEDNFDRFDLILSDNSSIVEEPTQDVGMEPLDNSPLSSYIIYSDQIRSDHIIHNNYFIHMRGIDNVDYRIAYEYIVECLDYLDRLIVKHQTLEAYILPLNIQANLVEV
jgi:hypothetical protein